MKLEQHKDEKYTFQGFDSGVYRYMQLLFITRRQNEKFQFLVIIHVLFQDGIPCFLDDVLVFVFRMIFIQHQAPPNYSQAFY